MDLIEFREYCLSLGEVTEKIPFGKFAKRYESILVFYVLGHMFCLTDIDNFTFIEAKADNDEIDRLTSGRVAIGKPINSTMKGWIHADLNEDTSETEIKDIIKNAYKHHQGEVYEETLTLVATWMSLQRIGQKLHSRRPGRANAKRDVR